MPHTRRKVIVDAPYERLSELLTDKMEKPTKYLGAILHSSILERNDGYIIREMYQPAPVPMTIREKISCHEIPGGREFVYEFLENEMYTGFFSNIIKRVDGRDDQVELEYVMHWDARPGTVDKISPGQADRMVELGVTDMKEIAENPPDVPDWVREFFDAADSLDSASLAPLLTEDCKFRMGNGPEAVGREQIVARCGMMTTFLAKMTHHYARVNECAERTFAECWVEYVKLDGSVYLLPFLTVFERAQGKISMVRAFGDASPLHNGWPES